jgi:acetylornithine deacetylase/succinyl-diaminopimelate desuccinylase-like protein
MNYESTTKHTEDHFEKDILNALCEFVKIDNLSPFFDSEWNSNGKLERAANFCLDWALNQGVKGIKGEVLKDADKSPLIFIEIDAFNGATNTIMLYGHFDKQPHFSGWAEGLGPTTPVIKNGFLYGRGAADDGYSLFSSISALRAVQLQGGKHGRVVIVIEGSEESGSPHLIPYLEKLADRIGSPDLMICLDSGALNYDTLWMTSSLRGAVAIDLTVECLQEGVHSGAGTGLAPDSFTIIRQLLDRIEDSKTGIVTKELHVEIPENRLQEAKAIADIEKENVFSAVKFLPGVKPLTDDYTELLLNNTWRPTLCVTGASGFPPHEIAGNVLRASTTVRCSVRLPPTLDGDKATEILENILTKDIPYNAKVTLQKRTPGNGWNNKDFSQRLQKSLDTSSLKLWGKETMSFGMGGSIPFIKMLADKFPKCEIVVCGVLGPDSNAHSCNEALHIQYCKNITTTIAHTINDYSS